MTRWTRARRRWSEISRRAAVVQSNVVLWVLYWIVVAPIGAAQRLSGSSRSRGAHWQARSADTADPMTSARQQF